MERIFTTLPDSTFVQEAKAFHNSTEFSCAMSRLDDIGIPRRDENGQEYSIVGRINVLWRRTMIAESKVETAQLRHNIEV